MMKKNKSLLNPFHLHVELKINSLMSIYQLIFPTNVSNNI